jgi:hypothetical protein
MMWEVVVMLYLVVAVAVVPLTGGVLANQLLQLQPILDLFAEELQDLGTGGGAGAHVAAGQGSWGALTRLVRVAVGGAQRREEGGGRAGIEPERTVVILKK